MTFVATVHHRVARKLTAAQVVAAIVERSGTIALADGSRTPLVLVRDASGRYRLTEKLFAFEDALPGRYFVRFADGSSVPHGHVLTADEATAAVRVLLGLEEPKPITVNVPPPSKRNPAASVW